MINEVPKAGSKRSRREVLAGAGGAVGVLAAQAILGAKTARAADGDPMFLGTAMSETATTGITNTNTTSGVVALYAASTAGGAGDVRGISRGCPGEQRG